MHLHASPPFAVGASLMMGMRSQTKRLHVANMFDYLRYGSWNRGYQVLRAWTLGDFPQPCRRFPLKARLAKCCYDPVSRKAPTLDAISTSLGPMDAFPCVWCGSGISFQAFQIKNVGFVLNTRELRIMGCLSVTPLLSNRPLWSVRVRVLIQGTYTQHRFYDS